MTWLKSLTWQSLGLWLFVAIIATADNLLLLDAWFDLTGRATITMFCRANPWAAAIILIGLQVGWAGLAVHFMAPTLIDKARLAKQKAALEAIEQHVEFRFRLGKPVDWYAVRQEVRNALEE